MSIDELIWETVEEIRKGIKEGAPKEVLVPEVGALSDLFLEKWPKEMAEDQGERKILGLRALGNQCHDCGKELGKEADENHLCKECLNSIPRKPKS